MKIYLVSLFIVIFCPYSFSQIDFKDLNPIAYVGGISKGKIKKELLLSQIGITCVNDSIKSDIRFRVAAFSLRTNLTDNEILTTNGQRFTKEMIEKMQKLRYNDTIWFFNILAKGYGYDSIQVEPIELVIKREAFNETMVDVFMALPIEYTPELYSTGKDSLIQFGYYKFPNSDSLEIRKINGNDFYFNISYYNIHKPVKRIYWPSSNGGHYDGLIISPNIFLQLKEFNNYNIIIASFGYSDNKQLKILNYNGGVLSESYVQFPDTPMISNFLKENTPDSVSSILNSKVRVYIDLIENKKDQFAFSIASIITEENTQWIKTDRIYYRLENETFIRVEE